MIILVECVLALLFVLVLYVCTVSLVLSPNKIFGVFGLFSFVVFMRANFAAKDNVPEYFSTFYLSEVALLLIVISFLYGVRYLFKRR